MNLTCATLATTLKAMTVAASIAVTGPCPAYIQISHAPSGSTLDFTAAPLTRLDVTGLSNITLKGIVATGSQWGGLYITSSDHIAVPAARIVRPGSAGITIVKSNFVDLGGSIVDGSSGDGFDIAGSTNVNIHDGSCINNVPSLIHPDCVQMWGLDGMPLQHITIQRMQAVGWTQGIDNFSAVALIPGTNDIKIMDNVVNIPYHNCIVFSDVMGLVITNNRCVTLPGGTQGRPVVYVTNSPGAVVNGNISS